MDGAETWRARFRSFGAVTWSPWRCRVTWANHARRLVQSDLFDAHPSVTVLPVTSDLVNASLFRLALLPDAGNGLQRPSQVMVDKPQSVQRQRLGSSSGRVDDETMLAVNRALAVFLGLA